MIEVCSEPVRDKSIILIEAKDKTEDSYKNVRMITYM